MVLRKGCIDYSTWVEQSIQECVENCYHGLAVGVTTLSVPHHKTEAGARDPVHNSMCRSQIVGAVTQ